MHAKPWAEMDEAEILLVVGHCDRRIAELKNLFGEFKAVSKTRQVASAHLRDRFGVDPRTGRRVSHHAKRGQLL